MMPSYASYGHPGPRGCLAQPVNSNPSFSTFNQWVFLESKKNISSAVFMEQKANVAKYR